MTRKFQQDTFFNRLFGTAGRRGMAAARWLLPGGISSQIDDPFSSTANSGPVSLTGRRISPTIWFALRVKGAWNPRALSISNLRVGVQALGWNLRLKPVLQPQKSKLTIQ